VTSLLHLILHDYYVSLLSVSYYHIFPLLFNVYDLANALLLAVKHSPW